MRYKKLFYHFLISLIFISVSTTASAQIYDPVKWKFSTQKLGDNKYELIFDATIDEGWKIYSSDIKGDDGPIPTGIEFTNAKGFKLIGKIKESGNLYGPELDPVFNMEIKFFKKKASFRQTIQLLGEKLDLKGEVIFMACTDESCIFPEPFSFSATLQGETPEKTDTQEPDKTNATPDITDTTADTLETITEENTIEEDSLTGTAGLPDVEETDNSEKKGLWGYLIAGLGSGLIALLTPCVFPMLPLTVSFFTKSSKTRRKGITNALIYAFSIIFIFVALGFIITLIFGPNGLNAMASNIYFNLIFFIVFIIFALSFFGAFEITLPSSLVNKADSASEKGGLIGIFFMAFTLVLVSFSCTAPIVGTLLVMIADSGEVMAPLMGMLGFSLALAIPFALFAAFPGWLNSLPKSGSWLNTVKVSLGFVELALALKFLSVVDLAYHWNFLTRDIFISLWIIIAILLGTYLIGKIRFHHEKELEHLSIPRLFFAIMCFGFAIYMVPGLWGAPVKLLSGIAPPQHYQEFSLNKLQFQMLQLDNKIARLHGEGETGEDSMIAALKVKELPTVTANMECPHELDCYFDYDKGMEIARKTGKPVLLDFTGWACVNCRKMEDNVWSDPKVWEIINEKYVLISLYVDDKTSLPDELQKSKYTNNSVKTVGRLWSDLQRVRFKANSQPYYVLLDHNEAPLVDPRGYTPSINEYINFLKEGVSNFEKKQKLQQAHLYQE